MAPFVSRQGVLVHMRFSLAFGGSVVGHVEVGGATGALFGRERFAIVSDRAE